jgi:hypothetical protein
MFGNASSSLVVALVLCCPMICGSAPLLHHHADSDPTSETPHAPHDSCTFDQCFCNGPSVSTHGPAYDIPVGDVAAWISPNDGSCELIACAGYLASSDRPPRSVSFDHSLPLLI